MGYNVGMGSKGRRGLAAAAVVSLCALSIASAPPAAPLARVPVAGLSAPVVVVDPGHNGGNGAHPRQINRLVDAGGFKKACNTVGTTSLSGMTEAAFNWAVAQKLGAVLVANGFRVVYTRADNSSWGPCVDERGLTAGRVGAVALLSVHGDGAPAAGHGFHVIWPTTRRGYTDRTEPASSALAAAVRDSLVAGGFTPSTYLGRNGLDRRGDLGTLNRASVPSMMVEAGNLRNVGDDRVLSSAEGQQRLAEALAAGFIRWYSTARR